MGAFNLPRSDRVLAGHVNGLLGHPVGKTTIVYIIFIFYRKINGKVVNKWAQVEEHPRPICCLENSFDSGQP